MAKVSIVIPNWNGAKDLPACLDSLLLQKLEVQIIVVDNGSKDNSLELLGARYSSVEVISLRKNRGFAGGVNCGIKKAMADKCDFVALFNNDAEADRNWLQHLVNFLEERPKVGIATCKLISKSNDLIDSMGECYTVWGLPYPRGRSEIDPNEYNAEASIFAASGGASLYRIKMLEEIGLFDEDFFAYYEDVDLSFRAQLAGWKVAYVPEAVAYHQIGATSGKIPGFTTYHTLKNLPLLMWKNVPAKLMFKVFPRFVLAYFMFWGRALQRGQIVASTKGVLMSILLWPKKLLERFKIQSRRKVSVEYINSIITHDLPPNAQRLRRLRASLQKINRG